MNNKKLIFILVIVSVVIFLLFPIESDNVPEWKIQTVDRMNKPVAGITVRQTWNIFDEDNREDLITDENGFVTFPKRVKRLPRLSILLQEIFSKVNHYVMPHGASDCPCAVVFGVNGGGTNSLHYFEGKELEHKLVVRGR